MYIAVVIIVLVCFALAFRYYKGAKKAYNDNVEIGHERVEKLQGRTITESDLDGLPKAVQGYLNYVGVVGKQMPKCFEIEIDGEMRFDETKDWADVTVKQMTFLDKETRLFYIVMKTFGVAINGLHHFENGEASMVIKILDIFKIIDNRGKYMNIAETVTYFNDMCIFAPAALIDADIKWHEVDMNIVDAEYTSNGITVSARLFFDESGRLLNFISEDRYASQADGSYKNVPWSTPIYEYTEFNGYNLVSKGEAIWHYDEGEFSYIRLNIKKLKYQ